MPSCSLGPCIFEYILSKYNTSMSAVFYIPNTIRRNRFRNDTKRLKHLVYYSHPNAMCEIPFPVEEIPTQQTQICISANVFLYQTNYTLNGLHCLTLNCSALQHLTSWCTETILHQRTKTQYGDRYQLLRIMQLITIYRACSTFSNRSLVL